MGPAKILTACFLAAVLAGCAMETETKVFTCQGPERNAEILTDDDTSTISLRKDDLVSLIPYVIGSDEVWGETAPKTDLEYHKSVAETYCRTGYVPPDPS